MNRFYSTISKALTFDKHSKPSEVLKVKNYELKMNSKSLLLRILAAPVNPSDINIIEGTYPIKPVQYPSIGFIGGQEGVAQVEDFGSEVAGFQKGDWVVPVQQSFNTWQTFATADSSKVVKLPDHSGVSAICAATISVNPPTAYRMIKDFVELHKGDVIIQNAANSAVGQAVIQIAKAWGYKTVNIIRSRPNEKILMDQLYSLGADLVITEDQVRTPETLAKIASLGRPSRLGFNAVGGKSATNLARLLGENAHLVTYGGMSREPVTLPTSLFIFKNLTSTGFWLNKWFLQRPVQDRIDIYSELFHLIRNGFLKEPIHETLSMTQSTDSELEQIGAWSNEHSKSKRILIP